MKVKGPSAIARTSYTIAFHDCFGLSWCSVFVAVDVDVDLLAALGINVDLSDIEETDAVGDT